jgi:uncharacterized protein YdaU (DUF1376 family)
MHYYQHHIGDFMRDTSNLTNEQMAVYLRMIWLYYLNERPLDDECEGIAFAVRSDVVTVRLLLKHFFYIEQGVWRHSRCDKEIEKFKTKSQKAKESANARWEHANAMRTHTERNADESFFDANHKPIVNITPIPPSASRKVVVHPGFEDFWKAYPKREGKKAAEKAWNKERPDLAVVLKAIEAQKQKPGWQDPSKQFIPQPVTWLNNQRWLDEVDGGGQDMFARVI